MQRYAPQLDELNHKTRMTTSSLGSDLHKPFMNRSGPYDPLALRPDIRIFWDDHEQMAQAIMNFENDWTGFKNYIEFEKSFAAHHHSKKEWIAQKNAPSSDIYGWLAPQNGKDVSDKEY
ncbi:hypothetical protein LguiB_012700 [Lonicera macranthoides]